MATELEEKDRIRETLHEISFLIDSFQRDKMAELYTEDAVWDGGTLGVCRGRDEIRRYRSDQPKPLDRWHSLSNTVIRVSGSEATARSYVTVPSKVAGGGFTVLFAGCYEDRLVKRGERWLVQQRRVFLDAESLAKAV